MGNEKSNEEEDKTQIFIKQHNNINVLAKYGQTVTLPCVIHRVNSPDLTNVSFILSIIFTHKDKQLMFLNLITCFSIKDLCDLAKTK